MFVQNMCTFYYLPHDGYSKNQMDKSADDHELDVSIENFQDLASQKHYSRSFEYW